MQMDKILLAPRSRQLLFETHNSLHRIITLEGVTCRFYVINKLLQTVSMKLDMSTKVY